METRIVIMGAAGRDFHVFNTMFRGNQSARVVAFTAAQIPNIDGRVYPAELAGEGYADGIPIVPEAEVENLVRRERVQHVIFAYSDVPFDPYLAERARRVVAAGADFRFPDPAETMLKSTKPVIAITAVRTGSGKSQTTRKAAVLLREKGRKVAVVRHPMPYGDLVKQRVQRFASIDDLAAHDCTIEEMEEYEPHIEAGSVVFAGVDYEAILREAERDADVILWDGGNNDTPFYAPDLWLCVADPLRPGHETSFYPGGQNFANAHAIIINKMNAATDEQIAAIERAAAEINPQAAIVRADSTLKLAGDAEQIRGKHVLAVEDGPTCTHGGMRTGAASQMAAQCGATLVDPRPYLVGSLQETFANYPTIGPLLPAMGYGEQQRADLAATIAAVPCDAVLIGTPIDLARVVPIATPHLRVTYDLAERGTPNLASLLVDF